MEQLDLSSRQHVAALYAAADADGDGQVSVAEGQAFLRRLMPGLTADRVPPPPRAPDLS